MEEIIFSNKIKKSTLKALNIVIGKHAKIEDGALLGANVAILGNSTISKSSRVLPNSVVENSFIGEAVEIKSSFIVNSKIGKGSSVGPFAHIRNNTEIDSDCRIGNFVEIKNSKISNNTKIAHLAYVGDADIGEHCNIGCGVIFCNYNGKIKQRSVIGNFVFIGSNANIVAPVNIGDYAYIAAGGTITKNVQENEFVIGRVRQEVKENFKNPYKENFIKD